MTEKLKQIEKRQRKFKNKRKQKVISSVISEISEANKRNDNLTEVQKKLVFKELNKLTVSNLFNLHE
jgi:hypothetical protein